MSSAKNQAERIKEISGVNPLKCMKCGKCTASCPAYDEMEFHLTGKRPNSGCTHDCSTCGGCSH